MQALAGSAKGSFGKKVRENAMLLVKPFLNPPSVVFLESSGARCLWKESQR